ncbi:hypothetical protein [Pseudonocardia sp. GCM10023141]|uniref:hypothetical protein n=1 Tax=Pseudonocardia sp. GCM10023141 TaxID=3252653 RepID=UPI003616CA61
MTTPNESISRYGSDRALTGQDRVTAQPGERATFTLTELLALNDAFDSHDDAEVARILATGPPADGWGRTPATSAGAQQAQAELQAREELQRWHAADRDLLAASADEYAAGWG